MIRKIIVATRRAHGGCNCVADSWFGVVAVICCNPEKEGTPCNANMAGGHGLVGGVWAQPRKLAAGGHPGEVYQRSVSASCVILPVGGFTKAAITACGCQWADP